MNSGEVVAGVIGTRKYIYDLWGDTVNTASRMESNGLPGGIQFTGETLRLLRKPVAWTSRGVIEIKGKGPMEAFILANCPP